MTHKPQKRREKPIKMKRPQVGIGVIIMSQRCPDQRSGDSPHDAAYGNVEYPPGQWTPEEWREPGSSIGKTKEPRT